MVGSSLFNSMTAAEAYIQTHLFSSLSLEANVIPDFSQGLLQPELITCSKNIKMPFSPQIFQISASG